VSPPDDFEVPILMRTRRNDGTLFANRTAYGDHTRGERAHLGAVQEVEAREVDLEPGTLALDRATDRAGGARGERCNEHGRGQSDIRVRLPMDI
jgi:hypothetical protein